MNWKKPQNKALPKKELTYSYLSNAWRKIKEKERSYRSEKISKAIEENKLTNDFYENSIYFGSLRVQTKIRIITKRTYPPLFRSSYNFLDCWGTTKPMTLKFSDFQFLSITTWLDYFILKICWRSKVLLKERHWNSPKKKGKIRTKVCNLTKNK